MRALFASPFTPLPTSSEGLDPLDPFTGQLSPTQGPFAMTMHSHYWAFYLLAENLRAESCVLEHPSLEAFEAELRKGYDFLGLQVNWNTLGQTAEMVRRARRLAPDTQVVVGGYAIPQVLDPLPPDREAAGTILEGAHHLCREEGVRFMRRLLGDRPLERPIDQFTLPRSGSYLAALGPAARGIGGRPILVALGCPAGCDFCNTSAFFRRRKIRVAEPEQAHSFMRHHLLRDGGERGTFELFDEDLYWQADYSRALGKLLRDDPVTTGKVGYFTFGSVRTLSKFDPEELVANGLSAVWIGVESTLDDVHRSSVHLGKRKGKDVATLFRELRDVGISTVGSLILGFDFHTPENVWRDVDAFVALAPTISQVTPLIPCAGTGLYERMKAEGRLDPKFGWTVRGGFQASLPSPPSTSRRRPSARSSTRRTAGSTWRPVPRRSRRSTRRCAATGACGTVPTRRSGRGPGSSPRGRGSSSRCWRPSWRTRPRSACASAPARRASAGRRPSASPTRRCSPSAAPSPSGSAPSPGRPPDLRRRTARRRAGPTTAPARRPRS